jgi:hypothetical protein
MPLEKFIEFLGKRVLKEELNKAAMNMDRKRQIFNNWMSAHHLEAKDVESMLRQAGYEGDNPIVKFIADEDPKKYSKLRIPGQENYR